MQSPTQGDLGIETRANIKSQTCNRLSPTGAPPQPLKSHFGALDDLGWLQAGRQATYLCAYAHSCGAPPQSTLCVKCRHTSVWSQHKKDSQTPRVTSVMGARVIFVLFFKLLSTFQVVYNVYSVVRNERKCVSATKLQKLLWKGSGKPMVAKVPAFRAGGALDGQEPGKAAVGPVRPQGLAQSCGTAGLTEPSGPPLCQSPELPSPLHPPRKTGSVTHGVGSGGTRSEFLASVKWPVWCQGSVPGMARTGQGLGQKWVGDWLCTQVSG